MAKVKRKRIVKPVISIKPTDPVNPDIQVKDELIAVPVAPDAITSCDGCCLYIEERCTDKESRDCTGVIFVKK